MKNGGSLGKQFGRKEKKGVIQKPKKRGYSGLRKIKMGLLTGTPT